MNHSSVLSIRLDPAHPDHHLWNNNGTWFVHYTIHPNAFTKERVRASLRTKSLHEARQKRDRLLHGGATRPHRSTSCSSSGLEATGPSQYESSRQKGANL